MTIACKIISILPPLPLEEEMSSCLLTSPRREYFFVRHTSQYCESLSRLGRFDRVIADVGVGRGAGGREKYEHTG